MNKMIRILGVIALVQIGLVVFAHMGSSHLMGQSPNQPLLSFDKEQVDTVIIKGKENAEVKLSKKKGKWQTEDGFPADQEKVNNLIEKLRTMKHGLAVANSDTAIKRFKVANDEFERHILFQHEDKKLAALYVGSGAGARQTHVRSDEDIAVYTVYLGNYDAPDAMSDWQDKKILHLKKESVNSIALQDKTFRRKEENVKDTSKQIWVLAELPEGTQVDQKAIDGALSSLVNLSFDKVLGKDSKPEYEMDKPILKFNLTHKEGEREYIFGKLKNKEKYILKVSDWPEYFELNEGVAKRIVNNISSGKWITKQAKEKPETGEASQPTSQPQSEDATEDPAGK